MYKFAVLFVAIAASYTVAAPTASEEIRKMPALVHEEVHDKNGQYSLQYVTAEGTIVIEKGRLVPNPDGDGLVMVVEGEVLYIGDDGKTYKTAYTAGFDGYKVVADHLPVAPAALAVPVAPAVPVVPAAPVASTVPVAPAVPVEPAVPVALPVLVAV